MALILITNMNNDNEAKIMNTMNTMNTMNILEKDIKALAESIVNDYESIYLRFGDRHIYYKEAISQIQVLDKLIIMSVSQSVYEKEYRQFFDRLICEVSNIFTCGSRIE